MMATVTTRPTRMRRRIRRATARTAMSTDTTIMEGMTTRIMDTVTTDRQVTAMNIMDTAITDTVITATWSTTSRSDSGSRSS